MGRSRPRDQSCAPVWSMRMTGGRPPWTSSSRTARPAPASRVQNGLQPSRTGAVAAPAAPAATKPRNEISAGTNRTTRRRMMNSCIGVSLPGVRRVKPPPDGKRIAERDAAPTRLRACSSTRAVCERGNHVTHQPHHPADLSEERGGRRGRGAAGRGGRDLRRGRPARRDGVQPVAVCDVMGRRREPFKAKGLAVYRDYREMLARGDIDAVTVATPTQWKPLHTVAAAKAGADVYCEKPSSLTIANGRAMVRRRTRAICRASRARRTSTGTCGWGRRRGGRSTRGSA